MTHPQHQIDEAARWLRSQLVPPRLAVPALKEQFGLSAVQACEAIAAARGLHVGRSNDAK